MNRKLLIGLGAAGAAVVLTLGGIAVANAVTGTPTPSPGTGSGQGYGLGGDGSRDGAKGMTGGRGETPLTGDAATQATAAAQKAVPGGTVLRVETDSDGTYEAHVRKADGTEVEVKMDKSFAVTSVETRQGRDGRGPGGRGGPNETPLTGDAATKATAAAQKAVPGGTVLRVETDGDGGAAYEAHVRKADGTEVVVKLDKSFAVTGVETFQPGGPRGDSGSSSGSSSTTSSTSFA